MLNASYEQLCLRNGKLCLLVVHLLTSCPSLNVRHCTMTGFKSISIYSLIDHRDGYVAVQDHEFKGLCNNCVPLIPDGNRDH